MSAPSDISSIGAEAKVLSEIERAVRAGAARALRARAAVQRKKGTDGTSSAGEQFPNVAIQSGEAAVAGRLARAFDLLADEIESEAVR
ncbi:MAG: hypothetical protein WAV18_12955 [Roseiarcus sp.]